MVSSDIFSFFDFLLFLLILSKSFLDRSDGTSVLSWNVRSWNTCSSSPSPALPPCWIGTCSAAGWRRTVDGDGRNGLAPSTRASSGFWWGSRSHRARWGNRCTIFSGWGGEYLKDVVELHHELRDLLLVGLEVRQQILHYSKVEQRPIFKNITATSQML